MQTNDCIHTALGPGQINDLLLLFYLDNGATSAQINDAEQEYLLAQGATPATVNDMWYEMLSGLGFTGALADMKNQFWCDGGTVTPYFLFSNASVINCLGVILDPSKPHHIQYVVDRIDATTGNNDIWGTQDGQNYGRLRDLDFRTFRGGTGGNLATLLYARNTLYLVDEEVLVAGTITVTMTPLVGPPLSQSSAGIGGAIPATDLQIGQRDGGLAFQGRISDFKMWDDTNTLVHHWPIDEGEGTFIEDIVGGLHGTLTPGTGTWVPAPVVTYLGEPVTYLGIPVTYRI